MSIATVEIVYKDEKKNKQIDIEFRMPDRRSKTLDVIEKAVEKKLKDDADWERWNLLNIK